MPTYSLWLWTLNPLTFGRHFLSGNCGLALDFWDRKVVVAGKELKRVTTRDRVREKLEWLERLVNAANNRVEEYNRKVKAGKEMKETPHIVDE